MSSPPDLMGALGKTGAGKFIGDKLGTVKKSADKHPIKAGLIASALGGAMGASGSGLGGSEMGSTTVMMFGMGATLLGVGIYAIFHGLDKKFGNTKLFQALKKVARVVLPILLIVGFLGVCGWLMFHTGFSGPNWIWNTLQQPTFYMALPLIGGICPLIGDKIMGMRSGMRRIRRGNGRRAQRVQLDQNSKMQQTRISLEGGRDRQAFLQDFTKYQN